MTAHTHAFVLVRPHGTIERCACGAWRHSANNTNPRIVNQPPTPAADVPDPAIEIGRTLARQVFAKRGNHSEVHLSELDLAALLALAAHRA